MYKAKFWAQYPIDRPLAFTKTVSMRYKCVFIRFSLSTLQYLPRDTENDESNSTHSAKRENEEIPLSRHRSHFTFCKASFCNLAWQDCFRNHPTLGVLARQIPLPQHL